MNQNAQVPTVISKRDAVNGHLGCIQTENTYETEKDAQCVEYERPPIPKPNRSNYTSDICRASLRKV